MMLECFEGLTRTHSEQKIEFFKEFLHVTLRAADGK